MKRLLLIVISLATVLSAAWAQNNPYAIDDVCYEYFKMSESLVDDLSNDAFDIANDAMLKRAQEVGDDKARTLHWVSKLKRASRIARTMKNRVEANRLVDRARLELMGVARETGYMQYFYYAFELAQNYYFNTRQNVHAQTLLQQMMETAANEGDEYGLWQSQRYLAVLYQRQNDLVNARKYLRRVINIYLNSNNPVIRRQSLTRQCCDMGDTFLRGSDSARFYYNLAEKTAILHADSLRVTFYKAQLAALDKQVERYRNYRDKCLTDDDFLTQLSGGDLFFDCADAIIEHKDREEVFSIATKIHNRLHMILLRDVAIAYSRENVAAWIGTNIIATLYADISYLNDMKMEELAEVQRSSEMTRELDIQQRRITLLYILVGILAAALLGLVTGFFISIRKKKHTK